ncbi:MAG: hypothetical protein SGJ18_04580 [Pseudomonadota bacterium]|nr:hypothetical protein [Pseudomonadota bacterium]
MNLETLHASTGAAIFLKNGIRLASANNPLREAEAWVSKNSLAFEKFDVTIVLGLGCGYHTHWASLKFPLNKIIVLEPDLNVIKWVKLEGPTQGKRVKILNVMNQDAIMASPELRTRLSELYSVLRHPASFQVERTALSNLEMIILGRTPASLRFLMKINPELSAHAVKLEKSLGALDGPLSIKDVARVMAVDQLKLGNFGAMTRICRELVR